jgi:hypothetical protein
MSIRSANERKFSIKFITIIAPHTKTNGERERKSVEVIETVGICMRTSMES